MKANDSTNGKDAQDWNEFKHDADATPLGVKISSGVGIWNTLTTAIALFTGTAFAMALVPWFAETPSTAATLALTIWGTFFMLLFWLESRFASTLVGGLISTATSGLKAAASSVVNIVKPSQASQVQSLAESTIDRLESSFGGNFDTDRIVSAIENFGNQVDQRLPSYDKLKRDLQDVMNDSSKKSGSNPAKWTAIQSVIQSAIDSGDKSKTEKGKQKSSQLNTLLTEFKANYDSEGSAKGAAAKTAKDNTSFDDKKINEYVAKVEETLQNSGNSDMNSDQLMKKLQGLTQGDAGSLNEMKNKLTNMNRDNVAKLIAKNTSLSKDQVNSYADQALKAISAVRDAIQGDGNSNVVSKIEDTTGVDVQTYIDQAQKLIAQYINTDDSGSTSLDMNALKREVLKAMSNSNDTLDTVKARLASFDADSIVKALPISANSTGQAQGQLQSMLNTAKSELETKVTALEAKAHGAYRQAERRAVIEAEHARKTASSAAWWLVVSIVVSGVAAIGGALVS